MKAVGAVSETERRAEWLSAIRGAVAGRPGPEAARSWAAAVRTDAESRKKGLG
ncbi:MAG: hypothetical protein ACYCTZ_04650 [Candidatus Dormibacteria bacterium]